MSESFPPAPDGLPLRIRVVIEHRVEHPYPHRADLAIEPRFATRVAMDGESWTLEDAHGETHAFRLHGSHWRTAPTDPHWLITTRIPALAIGDRVLMRWSTRSAPPSTPQADDLHGEIVGETPAYLEVHDENGVTRTHWRANGHEVCVGEERNRQRPVIVERWYVRGMNALRLTVLLCSTLAIAACGKKDGAGGGAGDEKSASGLAWTPVGYDKLTETCKKDLACCEDILKAEKADAKAEDYNLKCSGPALWKEEDCKMDLGARVTMLEGKTVPASCK